MTGTINILFFLYVFIYAGLFIWGVVLARKYGWLAWSNLVLLVILALIYDNGVLGLGRYIGEGEVLESLNMARYYLHAFFTPLLVMVAFDMIRRAEITWVRKKWALLIANLLTIGLIVYELVTEVFGITLEATWQHGVLSYDNVSTANGIPIMVIIVSVILLITSVILWWRQGWKWLFLGIALMTIGSAIPLPTESNAIANVFELILIFSIIVTIAFQSKLSRD